MNHINIYRSKAEMKQAFDSLGNVASLEEALVATGITAFFALLDGATVTIEGVTYRLVEVEEASE